VVELAAGAGVPVPSLSVVYRLVKLLDEQTRVRAS
jgi:ketopantoate reductase